MAVTAVFTPAHEMVATQSEGMQLHLSERSATGYLYVVAKPYGRFQALLKNQFLGSFSTAVEAAVCVARHLCGPEDGLPKAPGAKRGAKRRVASSGSSGIGGSVPAEAEARGGKWQRRQAAEACVAVGAVAEGGSAACGGWTAKEDERVMALVRAAGSEPAAHPNPNPNPDPNPNPHRRPTTLLLPLNPTRCVPRVLDGARSPRCFVAAQTTRCATATTGSGAWLRPGRRPQPLRGATRSLGS